MHAHSEFGLSLDGRGLSKITQGVTTEVLGEHLSMGPVIGPAVDDPMMITPPVTRTWTTLGGFFSFLQKKTHRIERRVPMSEQDRFAPPSWAVTTGHAYPRRNGADEEAHRPGNGRGYLRSLVWSGLCAELVLKYDRTNDRVRKGGGQLWHYLYGPYADRRRNGIAGNLPDRQRRAYFCRGYSISGGGIAHNPSLIHDIEQARSGASTSPPTPTPTP